MHTTAHPARHRAQLTLSEVSLMRGATRVLTSVDLLVTPSSRIAIVGENGRGKSSLLHVLAGALAPDSGTVRRIGTLAIAEQEMSADDDRTVGEAIADSIAEPIRALAELDVAGNLLVDGGTGSAERYAAALEAAELLDAWDAERRVLVALEALDAETDQARLLAELSVGQRYRVRLACLLGADHDFLLLDEPTNHLDRAGLEFLSERLRSRSGGVVIVSHDRAMLADVAETIVDLDPTPDALPRVYGNGYAGYRVGRVAERERWAQAHERHQVEQARLQDSLSAAQNRLVTGWRPEKGADKHGRATRAAGLTQSVHRRQHALEAHAVTAPEPPQLFRFPDLRTRPGAELVSVDEVHVAGRLAGPVSFALGHRGRLAITGPNGAGKSTLLGLLAGRSAPDSGAVRLQPGARVGFLCQESALPVESRAADVFERHLARLETAGLIAADDTVELSQLGLLRPREAGKRIGELSMGQRRRLDLALVLASKPHLLLLDEPTNHLSVALVDELTEALGATQAAVALSTHDRQLLRDVGGWPQLQLGEAGTHSVPFAH